MNLYEINSEYNRIISEVMLFAGDNEGEISEELEKALEDVQITRDEKIESTALYIKNLEAEAEMIKAEEKRLYNRRTVCENRADYVRTWLSSNLNGESFKTAKCVISWRKSEAVEIDVEANDLPEQYRTIKTVVSADKTALKTALKSGVTVEGVRIVTKQNMQVK